MDISFVRSRIVIDLLSRLWGVIQYVCVGAKGRVERGSAMEPLSCGIERYAASSEDKWDVVEVSCLETERCRMIPLAWVWGMSRKATAVDILEVGVKNHEIL